jgi:hypothetical protein
VDASDGVDETGSAGEVCTAGSWTNW